MDVDDRNGVQEVGRPERELCMVIDVFDQEGYVAPKANKRRLEDIEAACEEIARVW